MADEEKTVSGRIFAYSYVYNGGAVTATRLFFEDGQELTLKGHLHFPSVITVGVTYIEKAKKPNELKSIGLLAGGE
jgi:hypothetical protein